MKPYVASSKDMATAVGTIGGIPKSMLLNIGTIRPTNNPYGHPQTKPQSNTGMCIGNNLLPMLGTCAVKKGSIRPRARNNPDSTKYFVDIFFKLFPSKIKNHANIAFLEKTNTFVVSFRSILICIIIAHRADFYQHFLK